METSEGNEDDGDEKDHEKGRVHLVEEVAEDSNQSDDAPDQEAQDQRGDLHRHASQLEEKWRRAVRLRGGTDSGRQIGRC